MKNYAAIEGFVVAGLTAALLGVPDLGGLLVVLPLVIVAWVTLQLVSGVAFCDAIHKGLIGTARGPRGAKEVYFVAKGAKLGWLVKRHIWAYELIRDRSAVPVPRASSTHS